MQVFELYTPGEWTTVTRRVDEAGILRIPGLGAVPAAGATEVELETLIRTLVAKELMADPQITVAIVRDASREAKPGRLTPEAVREAATVVPGSELPAAANASMSSRHRQPDILQVRRSRV